MVYNLKKLRNEMGISQQQLADVIGLSQQSINKYENHAVEPDISTLIALSKFFNTSIDFLVGNTDVDRVIENVKRYDLNAEEEKLVGKYRKLGKKEKESIKLIIDNYTKK